MAVPSRAAAESDVEYADTDPAIEVTAHSASKEKTVFTEPGNRDGWIATDYVVALER